MSARFGNGCYSKLVPSSSVYIAQYDPIVIHSLSQIAPFGHLSVFGGWFQRPTSFDHKHGCFVLVVFAVPTQDDSFSLFSLDYGQIERNWWQIGIVNDRSLTNIAKLWTLRIYWTALFYMHTIGVLFALGDGWSDNRCLTLTIMSRRIVGTFKRGKLWQSIDRTCSIFFRVQFHQ